VGLTVAFVMPNILRPQLGSHMDLLHEGLVNTAPMILMEGESSRFVNISTFRGFDEFLADTSLTEVRKANMLTDYFMHLADEMHYRQQAYLQGCRNNAACTETTSPIHEPMTPLFFDGVHLDLYHRLAERMHPSLAQKGVSYTHRELTGTAQLPYLDAASTTYTARERRYESLSPQYQRDLRVFQIGLVVEKLRAASLSEAAKHVKQTDYYQHMKSYLRSQCAQGDPHACNKA
jgi:hypothetical protein